MVCEGLRKGNNANFTRYYANVANSDSWVVQCCFNVAAVTLRSL